MTWPWAVPLAIVVALLLTISIKEKLMSWAQPICDDCWDEQHPDHPSQRLNRGDPMVCCFCGTETHSGIYVRVNPSTVPYPSEG